MSKKQMTLKKTMITAGCAVLLAGVLVAGNVVTNIYGNLLDVYFSSSDYVASDSEKEHCQRVVEEGIVLLKNEDNALPLKENEKKVSLLGQNCVDFVYGGAGSGSVDTKAAPTLKTALEQSGFTVNETLWTFYTEGAGASYRKTVPDETGRGEFKINEVPQSVYTDNVLSSLKESDVGIVSIGRSGGESADIPRTKLAGSNYSYLQVNEEERETLKLACKTYEKVILIVNANNVMELGFLNEAEYKNVKAVLWIGGVGQEGMYAIGEVMNGNGSPSGRTADTYAYDSLSAPSNANLGSFTISNYVKGTLAGDDKGDKYINYQEGIYVGYKYYETRYEDFVLGQGNAGNFQYDTEVQYPFGYGLSYTQFNWTDYKMEEKSNSFEISLTVKNVGNHSGKDVVEIYMQSPYTAYDKQYNVEKSAVELVGFAKTKELSKGASEKITVSIPKESLKAYDYTNAKTYIVDEGTYYFTAAQNAHEATKNVLSAKDQSVGGERNLVASYTVGALDTTTYANSVATGYEITNQFDQANVSYYETDNVFLTRSNWEGTFPKNAYKNGTWTASEKMLNDLHWYRADEVVNDSTKTMPSNSVENGLTVNDMIGVEFEDEKWDELVNALSWNQMARLVRMGGYSTVQLDIIALPATQDKDGPSGISGTLVGGTSCMAWPTEVVMASTWNTDLIEQMGVYIGEDSVSAGVAGWYAPGANIHRSPYSGRNFEYYSEDGILSGLIGAAEMRGVRSMGVIAYMKHFALNDQETNRYGVSVFANEQAIREIFLKGFEYIAREGKSTAVMCSMNRVGTRWSGAHKGLMTEVLRNEWGFKGMVITDQASVSAMFYQDMVSGLWAGCDLWLNTNSNFWSLNDYKSNATVSYYIHRAAKNIIYSVVNSNAVQEYSGIKVEVEGTPVWRTVRLVLNIVLGAVCVVGIILPTTLYLVDHKKKAIEIE